MRAAVVSEIGQLPELSERPDPGTRDGETLIEVLAVPLNPIDVAIAAGRFYGGQPDTPYVPGCEAVGRVRESGTLDAGTTVWAYGGGLGHKRDGGLAELLAAPDTVLTPVPEEVDPALAGTLGIAGLAGWLPVAWRAPVREGETVLVLGATGTVGLVAVQAARLLGAGRVVAAGRRPEALERAAECGADATVRIDEVDDLAGALREACGGEGPNLIVDPLWGEPLAAALEAAAVGARSVNVGQSAGTTSTITSNAVRGKQLEIYGHANAAAPREVLRREYERLVEHTVAGEIRVDLERVPFDDVTEAWRRQAEGAGCKLVVVP
jgi:NADPH2:quinone reductase